MKKLALVAVATTLVLCGAPVLAQDLGVSIGNRGGADISVRGGDRDASAVGTLSASGIMIAIVSWCAVIETSSLPVGLDAAQ
jgi:hypothetical protein